MTITKRLEAIAGLIPKNAGVADVGTDHGCIPVWLRQHGFTGRIAATDINPAPLKNAERTAESFGLLGEVEFCLCDGLSMLDGEGIDCIVIAGMGGETIASILSACLWAKQGRTLVLQPMTKADLLREWLVDNCFAITAETLVRDGIIYELITARGGSSSPLSEAEKLTGSFELIGNDPLFPERLEELLDKTARVIAGITSAKRPDPLRLNKEQTIYRQLLEMRERLDG